MSRPLPLLDWAAPRKRRRLKAPDTPKAPAPKEVVGLHIPVVDFLNRFIAPGWRFMHPATGEHRDKRTAAKLKAMGAKAGWPDLVLIDPNGLFHGLELKRAKTGRLSEAQEDFLAHARAYGWPVAVVDSIDAAVAVLDAWGALRVRISTGGGR